MNEPPRCPKCNFQLPPDAPAGLCPKCLVLAGFESQPPGSAFNPEPTQLSPASARFQPPSLEELADKFPKLEVLELLGKGGMGAVYKARQPGLDRLVAVKILPVEISDDPDFVERFQREARALAKLSHPHIVAVYDYGQIDDLCYIIMEFVDGTNLRQAVRTKTLASDEALAIVPQICEALQFAHDEGVVHRDIKPENILIDKRGRVKIADFGLAKLIGPDAIDHSLTAAHQVMGTLQYMAPEQMKGTKGVDHRADIYSLGVVFYELLTGELPMGRFAPPSTKVHIDVRLDEVVLRALEQDPEQRYQHASDVKTDMETIRTTVAPPPKPAEQRDPLDGFRELARFAMTPNASYAKRVGVPMLILFGLWLAATITAHVVYGQKANYQEGPILLVQGGGIVLYILIVFFMNLAFVARSRAEAGNGSGALLKKELVTVSDTRRLVQAPADSLFLSAGIAGVTACGVFIWLGAAANLEGQANMWLIRGNLLGMSTVLAVYSAFVVVAGWLMRHLRARLVVLSVCVIVGLFLPAVIALNVIMELRNIPVWPVAIPFWLGIPAAFWAAVTLFREEVRHAFDVTADERTRRAIDLGKQSPFNTTRAPRFSRFAIAGAVWAIFGLLVVIPVLFFIGLNRVWNGEALPTDVIHSEPPLVFTIFMGALLAIGAGAPIGTTIYGAIAIGHIKRSGGKIIGLPLGVADAIFFPLLLLGGIIAFPSALVFGALAPHPNAATLASSAALGTIVASIVCFFVGRAVWRAIAGGLNVVEIGTSLKQ